MSVSGVDTVDIKKRIMPKKRALEPNVNAIGVGSVGSSRSFTLEDGWGHIVQKSLIQGHYTCYGTSE